MKSLLFDYLQQIFSIQFPQRLHLNDKPLDFFFRQIARLNKFSAFSRLNKIDFLVRNSFNIRMIEFLMEYYPIYNI